MPGSKRFRWQTLSHSAPAVGIAALERYLEKTESGDEVRAVVGSRGRWYWFEVRAGGTEVQGDWLESLDAARGRVEFLVKNLQEA